MSSHALRSPVLSWSVANGVIANAPGRNESTVAGAPKRSDPISAPSRATSVESCSGVGCARVNSRCCSTRPGVGSMTMVTHSTAAAGGCDSRSRSASVRSVRTSRTGDGSSRRRTQVSRGSTASPRPERVEGCVTRPSRTCSTAAPRSRRSRRVASGSSSRVRTNDSGSRSSIGHSSSSDDSKRSSASVGTSGRMSSPRAIACHIVAGRPSRDTRSAAGSAASSPSVFSPHLLNAKTAWFDTLTMSARPEPVEGCELRARSSSWIFSRMPMGIIASAAASSPRGITVSPGRASARTSAAMRVPATATCARTPRAAASRPSSSPMARAGPTSRASPLTSIDTRSSRCRS